MAELMAFLSSFSSYLFVFFVFVIAIVVAAFIGITLYKITHTKKLQEEVQDAQS